MSSEMKKPCVVLGVTGGIAVYKACELLRLLQKRGIDVFVVMTRNACRFVAPLTFETLSGHPVAVDTFDRPQTWEVEHIALAKRADLFLIAPATANIMGKMACGIAAVYDGDGDARACSGCARNEYRHVGKRRRAAKRQDASGARR